MNYIAFVFLGLIFAILIYISIRLMTEIRSDYRGAKQLREHLAYRIRSLRMLPMLGKHGIDMEHYLHNFTISDIERHIRQCESCDRTDDCDAALSSPASGELPFCANDESFRKLTKTHHH